MNSIMAKIIYISSSTSKKKGWNQVSGKLTQLTATTASSKYQHFKKTHSAATFLIVITDLSETNWLIQGT